MLSYEYSKGTDSVGGFIYSSLNFPVGATWDRRDSITDATRNFYVDVNAKPFVGFGTTGTGAQVTFDTRGYKGLGAGNRVVMAARLQGGAILWEPRSWKHRAPICFTRVAVVEPVRGQPYQSLGATVKMTTACRWILAAPRSSLPPRWRRG